MRSYEATEEKKGSVKPRKGPWTPEEHQLFLEGLKTYGKDWVSIQKHIGTRDTTHCRSHAQKFMKMLVRLLENKKTKLKLSMQEANFYFGVLNAKFHKTFDQEEEH